MARFGIGLVLSGIMAVGAVGRGCAVLARRWVGRDSGGDVDEIESGHEAFDGGYWCGGGGVYTVDRKWMRRIIVVYVSETLEALPSRFESTT